MQLTNVRYRVTLSCRNGASLALTTRVGLAGQLGLFMGSNRLPH
jgi:hypothetical protein